MFYCPLRPTLRIIAIYAIVCLFWAGFADRVAPKIIAAAYDEQNLSILHLVFRSSLPVKYYLDRWSVIAAAGLLAAILHLVIVLFICGIERKRRTQSLDAGRPSNTGLVVFSAAFLAIAVLSGAEGDYKPYLEEWTAVLEGGDPWEVRLAVNAYGPLFNVLAPLVWVNPLANKLLFAFSYLVYVIWLIKDFAPRRGVATFSWPWVSFWLLNPFPWEQIAFYGYFDVLVSLACVAAVHSLVSSKDGASGTYLALGILLKYMPIVILPFLVFSKRRFHFRLLSFCAGVLISGLVVSVLIWGSSTFMPLIMAATRVPVWSIYNVLASSHFTGSAVNIVWLEKPLWLTAGMGVFTWCILREIEPALSSTLAILVTLLFYRMGYPNYQMVLFSLVSYWAVSNWAQLKEHSVLATLLIGYFCFLTIVHLAVRWVLGGSLSFYIVHIVETVGALSQFLLGCTLLICLVKLRPYPILSKSVPI